MICYPSERHTCSGCCLGSYRVTGFAGTRTQLIFLTYCGKGERDRGSPPFVYVFEFCVLTLSFIYLAMAALGLRCCTGFSLVEVSEVSSALQPAGSSLLWLLFCC